MPVGIVLLLLCLGNSGVADAAADIIFRGGQIITMNPDQPRVEALAVKGGESWLWVRLPRSSGHSAARARAWSTSGRGR
jgi:hypothetical protein